MPVSVAPPPSRPDVNAPFDLVASTFSVHLPDLGIPTGTSKAAWSALSQRWNLDLDGLLDELDRPGIPPATLHALLRASTDVPTAPHPVEQETLRLIRQEGRVARLLAHGAVPDHAILAAAAQSSNPRLVQRLLDAGGDRLDWGSAMLKRLCDSQPSPAANERWSVATMDRWSPMFAAVTLAQGNSATIIADLMRSAGTPVDLRDPSQGNTPLHWAIIGRHRTMIPWLLDQGADPNATNDDGHTPMHLAAEHNLRWAAELLHQHGAHLDPRTPPPSPGQVPGQSHGYARARLLAGETSWDQWPHAKGRPVAARADTPLIQAAHQASFEMLQWLIGHGVNPCPPVDPNDPSSPLCERALILVEAGIAHHEDKGWDDEVRQGRACADLLHHHRQAQEVRRFADQMIPPQGPAERSRTRL